MRAMTEHWEEKALRLTRSVLAGWTEPESGLQRLALFFGDEGLRNVDADELNSWRLAPACRVTLAKIEENGGTSGICEAKLQALISYFLPREVALLESTAPPSKPSATGQGTGAISAEWRYALTGYTDAGETYASELSDVVVVAGVEHVAVTTPVGVSLKGRRLWRTPTTSLCARFHSLLADNVTTLVKDRMPDSELGDEVFPEKGLLGNLTRSGKRAIVAREVLDDESGEATLDATLKYIDQGPPRLDASRNQRVKEFIAEWTLQFDYATGQSLSGE